MIAPVGHFVDEAGDADLFFAPHHKLSIAACIGRGNRVRKILRNQSDSGSLTDAAGPL
jgi:hypothetical protein